MFGHFSKSLFYTEPDMQDNKTLAESRALEMFKK